jgi:hypothetical protein
VRRGDARPRWVVVRNYPAIKSIHDDKGLRSRGCSSASKLLCTSARATALGILRASRFSMQGSSANPRQSTTRCRVRRMTCCNVSSCSERSTELAERDTDVSHSDNGGYRNERGYEMSSGLA